MLFGDQTYGGRGDLLGADVGCWYIASLFSNSFVQDNMQNCIILPASKRNPGEVRQIVLTFFIFFEGNGKRSCVV
jgi:hypothetical protein